MTNEPNDRVGETPRGWGHTEAWLRDRFEGRYETETWTLDELLRLAKTVYRKARIDARRTPDTADDERAVLAELLRLYDWRFELAEEERALMNTPIAAGDIRELAQLPDQVFDATALLARRKLLTTKLRQYGREKKAAWDRAREVLARRTTKEGKGR